MSDWETVAVSLSGLAGVLIGGGVGYLGARLQASVARDQADITRRQIELEAARHREERRDASVQRRFEIYYDFLRHERWLVARLTSGIDPIEDKGYLTWLDGYNHRYIPLVLSASSPVRQAAQALDEAYELFLVGYSATHDGRAAFVPHKDAITAARERVIEAVRAETTQ